MKRRSLLKLFGFASVGGPSAVYSLISESDAAQKYIDDINARLGEAPQKYFTNIELFNKPVSAIGGDRIIVTGRTQVGDHLIERERVWDINAALTSEGTCLEGLLINTPEGYRLATDDEVTLELDSLPNMSEVILNAARDQSDEQFWDEELFKIKERYAA